MFFWKNGLSKVLFLKNKYRIRFIHAILLPKKVLNICFQTFYFFSIPPTVIAAAAVVAAAAARHGAASTNRGKGADLTPPKKFFACFPLSPRGQRWCVRRTSPREGPLYNNL
jgi:hypothetical protein